MPADSLAHTFADPYLLDQALTHRSWCAEHPGEQSNERLEFLGDAVVSLAVADYVYRSFPDMREGQLAKVRAEVVSASTLADVARRVELGAMMRLGRGEISTGGQAKVSILADTFEAVIGAVFIDAGWSVARDVVLHHLADRIESAAHGPGADDYKTRLQEALARQGTEPPDYQLSSEGPDHDKRFTAAVLIGGEVRGTGQGTSKKQAEQAAARSAWSTLVHDTTIHGS